MLKKKMRKSEARDVAVLSNAPGTGRMKWFVALMRWIMRAATLEETERGVVWCGAIDACRGRAGVACYIRLDL